MEEHPLAICFEFERRSEVGKITGLIERTVESALTFVLPN